MKDVVLANNRDELAKAEQQVAGHEQAVLTSFKMVDERFLGDKYDIDSAHRAFCDWKRIRQEVIELISVLTQYLPVRQNTTDKAMARQLD